MSVAAGSLAAAGVEDSKGEFPTSSGSVTPNGDAQVIGPNAITKAFLIMYLSCCHDYKDIYCITMLLL